MMWRFTEGNAQPEEIDMIWELSKQVRTPLFLLSGHLNSEAKKCLLNTTTCRLRATPSALWLTALPGQFKVLSGTSGQSWKTGEQRFLLLTFPSTWSNFEILLKFN